MDIETSPADSQKTSSTLLCCCMCQSIYKHPKILPCLHSFCRHCLEGAVASESGTAKIVCAVCSFTSNLPPNGVTGVRDNCFLERMCQEYLMQVQDHLVARSFHSAATGGFSELALPTRRLSSEVPRSSYTTFSSSVSQDKKAELHSEAEAGQASGQSTANTVEAIRNMSRLQTKVMSLQGEALRVTYAIDQVNQSIADWQQHKEEIKKAIQRRSEQFQFFIKRMEHQLINQIDSKQSDDICYSESNKSKTDLRKNLNNILHEVNVLKSIQEFGKDAEINALSANLLGKSVGLTDVVLKKLHFDIDTPTRSIEEIVSAYFGEINLSTEENQIFSPEILDFTEILVGNMTESLAGKEDSHFFNESREISFEENQKLENAAVSKSSFRRSVDRRSRRHNTDLGLNKEDVKEYLAQFQNARETFSTRRKEILARGQQAREDTSPLRDETQRRPRSPSRIGRVQSLDRVALPVTLRGRIGVPKSSDVQAIKTTNAPQPDNLSQTFDNKLANSQPESAFKFGRGAGGKHFVSGLIPPSPVIEEVPSPTSPQKILVKQTSDPVYPYYHPSPDEKISLGASPLSPSRSLMEPLRSRRSSNPSTSFFMGRRFSDQNTPLSPEENTALSQLKHESSTSRPVRRAFSSVTDRRTKIEFLRENWQKRKEILIQNEGFVTTDSIGKQEARPPAQILSPVSSDSPGKVVTSESVETKSNSPPPASSENLKLESMHQIRSRIAQYRNELSETRQHEMKNNMSPSPSIQVSKQLSSTLEAQNNSTGSPATSPTTTAAQTQNRNEFTKLDEINNMDGKSASYYPRTQESKQASNNLHPQRDTTGLSPATTATQAVAQTTVYKQAPVITTATGHTRQEPVITTSPLQTKALPSSQATTTSSRLSRFAKPVETVDVASLISAMYGGKEKTILHDNTPASDTASKPSVTEHVTNNITTNTTVSTITTSGSRAAESINSTTSTTLTTAYSYKYQTENPRNLSTPQTNGCDNSTESLAQSQLNNDNPVESLPQSQLNNDNPVESLPQSQLNNDNPVESLPQSPRKPNRSGMRSRFTDGGNRRHTIEIGKSAIQSALAMIAKENTNPIHQTPLHPISESPPASRTQLYTPYFSRFTDSSSSPRMLETDEPIETDDIKDVTIAYKIRASGVTTKIIPSSLEVIQEKSQPEQSLTSESTSATPGVPPSPTSQNVPPSPRSQNVPPSPTSPNAVESAQRVRLREIARQKKERWRHLTIH